LNFDFCGIIGSAHSIIGRRLRSRASSPRCSVNSNVATCRDNKLVSSAKSHRRPPPPSTDIVLGFRLALACGPCLCRSDGHLASANKSERTLGANRCSRAPKIKRCFMAFAKVWRPFLDSSPCFHSIIRFARFLHLIQFTNWAIIFSSLIRCLRVLPNNLCLDFPRPLNEIILCYRFHCIPLSQQTIGYFRREHFDYWR
jgi:hypothetical protein